MPGKIEKIGLIFAPVCTIINLVAQLSAKSEDEFMDKGLEKNITIADVAEALGVSKTTVSRAISGKGRIGRETRERVLAYIEEHDYKPNVIAKGLAQSKTYNICVVMPGEYDVVDLTFFQECLFGIQEIAGSMEYDILLSICRKNDISSLERIIANHKVDGVILMRTFVEDEQIDFLQTKMYRLSRSEVPVPITKA